MPKQRITKEMVIEAAFELARQGGLEQVLVKNIAGPLDVRFSRYIAIVLVWRGCERT